MKKIAKVSRSLANLHLDNAKRLTAQGKKKAAERELTQGEKQAEIGQRAVRRGKRALAPIT